MFPGDPGVPHRVWFAPGKTGRWQRDHHNVRVRSCSPHRPNQVNHHRYEALRAFFIDGLTHQQAGERLGYTRWLGDGDLMREYRPRT